GRGRVDLGYWTRRRFLRLRFLLLFPSVLGALRSRASHEEKTHRNSCQPQCWSCSLHYCNRPLFIRIDSMNLGTCSPIDSPSSEEGEQVSGLTTAVVLRE